MTARSRTYYQRDCLTYKGRSKTTSGGSDVSMEMEAEGQGRKDELSSTRFTRAIAPVGP